MLLTGISMVKNEADIIEAFVRHNMKFLDRLYVLDHSSFDGTREILTQLIQEGYPIVISDIRRLGYHQSEEMTRLCRWVFEECSPDNVFVLDADEFIVAKDRQSIENKLIDMPRNSHALIPWRTYVPCEQDPLQELNPVVRIRHRRNVEPNQYFKVVISRYFDQDQNQFIAMGNHSVSGSNVEIQHIPIDDILLAHFPVHTCDQITAKVIVGWVNSILAGHMNPGKGGILYHWHDLYDK